MKKKAITLAVTLTFSMGIFGGTAFAKDVYTGQIDDERSYNDNLSAAKMQQLDELDSIWVNSEQTVDVAQEDTPDNTHLIELGDTLFSLALAYNVTVEDLKEWNNLTSDLILTGDTLAIDASAAKPKTQQTIADNITKPVTTTVNTASDIYTMRATAYTAYCEGCSGITANGTDIRSNPNLKVIAVDPRVIPLGTKVWVEGYGEAIAADTGGAIKGNKIDVFIPSDGQARNWGVRTVTVKILN